jgi:glutamyl-tRNA(Gln) amidotransferase subunit E
MPLIETVTYPDCTNPDEVREACDYIRFLNRSTGKVRTGMGAGREDVNVSCCGGSRVEIKGVAHTKWIPELTHNECFRQWALLAIREELKKRIKDPKRWQPKHQYLKFHSYEFTYEPLVNSKKEGNRIVAINLPHFKGLLSHFTQPGKMFSDEFADRLKVIACLEKPNMTHSEELDPVVSAKDFNSLREMFKAGDDDAQIIIWGPDEDLITALETVEERCRMAFEGVPNETRKSFEDGTTIFERVLPGADRMYPDTDSPPIPLTEERIQKLSKNLPEDVIDRYKKMKAWKIPEDAYTFIFTKNLFPIIERIVNELNIDPVFVGTFFGHTMKYVEGHHTPTAQFSYDVIYDLFAFLVSEKLDVELAKNMIAEVYEHPKMEFESVLTTIKFKRYAKADILAKIPFLKEKFAKIKVSEQPQDSVNWAMGQLRNSAVGNISMKELVKEVEKEMAD